MTALPDPLNEACCCLFVLWGILVHLLCSSSGPCTFLHWRSTVLVRHHLILIRICVHLLLLMLMLMMLMVILVLLTTCSSFRMVSVALRLPEAVLLQVIPSSTVAALRELLLTAPILATNISFASFLSTFLSAFALVILAMAIPPFSFSSSFSATTSSAAAFSASLA